MNGKPPEAWGKSSQVVSDEGGDMFLKDVKIKADTGLLTYKSANLTLASKVKINAILKSTCKCFN